MEDDVPVCDVLCEAMEYLSKLGSNLRSRSDTLKERKIRRDKLKNSHAVQKAANKVLMICELSKKSLENVENGVKKIMKLVDESQKGGKSSAKKSISGKKQEMHYISYKSRKLRIAQKISLAHYTSVKVMARKMTSEFQEKYPVYHDCILYRLRKKKSPVNNAEKINLVSSSDSIGEEVPKRKPGPNKLSVQSKDIPEEDCKQIQIKKRDTEDKTFDTTFKIPKKNDRKEPDSDEPSTSESDKPKPSKSNQQNSSKEKSKNQKSRNADESRKSSGDKSDDSETQIHSKERIDLETRRQSKDKRRSSESGRESKDRRENSECRSESLDRREHSESGRKSKDKHDSPKKCKKHKKSSKSHRRKREKDRFRNDFSSSDDDAPKKKHKISTVIDSSSSEEDSKRDKPPKKNELSIINLSSDEDYTKISSPVKKNRVISSESEDSTDMKDVSKMKDTKIESTLTTNTVVNLEFEDPTDKRNVNKIKTKAELKDTSPKRKASEETVKSSSEDDSLKTEKPAIKLVSLSKLLKPTVLQNVSKQSIIKINEHNKEKERLRQKSCLDQEKKFWAPKREAVKAFKAKEFSIKVKKLPKFSVQFMHEHALERITKSNDIVFEVENYTHNKASNEDTNKKTYDTETQNIIEDVLLKDLESEKSPTGTLVYQAENAKIALLEDSDADSNDVEKTTEERVVPETENGKPDDLNSSNNEVQTTTKADNIENVAREKTPEKSKLVSESDLAKSSLLCNSEPSTPTTGKKRDKSDSVTPSKRKHAMESMHAKQMLLTYSSSETEDEQLNSVIKNIQNELLSDDEGPKLSHKKKRSSDSESDEDFTTRPKKKKKTGPKSKQSESDKERSDNDGGKDKSHEENQSENSDAKENISSAEKKNGSKKDSADNPSDSDSSKKKMGRTRQKKGSSSNNSDGSEDKAIHGLTNLKTLSKSRRRRDSAESEQKQTATITTTRNNKAKALFEGDGLLEAPLSSDEASDNDRNSVEEDLPRVTVSNLNGSGGIEQLAKGDLLGSESDDSADQEKDNNDASDDEEDKKQENSESDDDGVKARRRKANTISSESETEASRRKKDPKSSDFEESGSDSEPTKKKTKKKRKKSTDNESSGSDNEAKKKRRRIKSVNDDSDASGSDSDNDGKNKHGRKNIRKVMGKNQLEEATKKAAREEKERVARIAERQRVYNNLQFDESGKPDEVVLDKVVLDFDPDTKEPLIEVDRGLVKKLKPHQANGIKFMWDACFESVKRIKKDKGSGCILAHCMGLGKTLQVVSLTHTLLIHSELTTVNRVLVVCPLSTVLNWVNEFRMWLEHAENSYEVDVYELSRYKQNSERAYQLTQWYKHGGVCVLGYEMFRNLSADNVKKFKKKMLKQFQESLVDPGPDMVVCDEGHLLKNEKTSLSQSMNRVRTRRRIVLTGTPLQNNLKEYYCMVTFVKPNLLGKYNEYLNRFVNPITNGQYTDSTEHDIKIMKRRSHVLHKMLDGAVQRRDYGVLAPFLPPKHEYVLFITLTDVQIKLYKHYLENYSRRPLAGKSSGFLFPDFQSLQRIWTHPLVLKYNSERYEIMLQKKRDKEEEEDSEGSLVDFIDDESTPPESSTEDSMSDLSDVSDDSRKKSKKKKNKKTKVKKESRANNKRPTRANPELDEEPLPELPAEVKNDNPTEWWIPLVTEDELDDLRNSNKLVLLFEILRQCEAIGDKLLVFSQSLYSLDLIEHFLGKVDEATQEGRVDDKLGGHVGSWSPGIDYFRLDGSTSCENRSIWCKNFNREDNPRARLFLISTRAGGLGINLVAANRVVIFDVSWNPSHDVQSIFRVYRFGQKKPCYVYRFLAMGTMEEKIYERQVTKQAISKRVIDEQQIDRHYAENDLAELYNFEPVPPMPRPVPPVPKDRFFAEMLKDHAALIYKFHEHDSLLENKEEETLSEEERKAAWDDFENEKNRPPPVPFAGMGMYNGMMPSLQLAQQQQQLAYAALNAVLRKDMPNLSEEQIRGMIPLIYSANPAMFGGYDYGLMQKLNDMYKFTAPGMMNPGMMNPAVMNPAGAAAMGGGSSGLQYEPPWQRQQQAQQNLRLQQLMQQQNSMGAKFYAGGLGSRDPVAMAMQQQRAREIMLGDQSRPRGRPPGSARAPPRQTGDVVNLDSD